ncbi:hypothetical protein ACMV8I_07160 [Ewingella sp. S1.OA.A_B6]
MLTRWIVIAAMSLLAGCVDLGHVGSHPQLKEAWFPANVEKTYTCLYSAALVNHLRLEEDESLPGGRRRFNLLNQNDELVAWLDMARSGKQTDVDFFYGRNDKPIEQRLMAMIKQCRQELN